MLPEGTEAREVQRLRHQVDHIDSRSHIAQLTLDSNLASVGTLQLLPPDPEAADQDASLISLPDGRLLLFSFTWYPLSSIFCAPVGLPCTTLKSDPSGGAYLFWGANVRHSADGGCTWSEPRYLPSLHACTPSIPGKRPMPGGAVSGTPVYHGGEVLVASYCDAPGRPSAAHLWRSGDQGESWSYGGVVAADPRGQVQMQEPALHRTASGKILAFLRTAGIEDRLVTAESDDGGHTWAPWRVRETVGHPYHPLRLNDGRVLLVYGYRHRPFGIRCRLLNPDCTDLDGSEEHVIREDAANGDIGYPWAAQMPDGRVIVAYYFNDAGGPRYIAASILEIH
jgi:hypothetical protein